MKPKEFSWDESQQVTVKNPTEQDFKFKTHSKEYMVKAGQTVKMPGFIAWKYVYSLGCKMAQDAGDFIHWNEEGFRQKYYDKLVVGADTLIQEVVVQPEVTFEEVPEDTTPKPARKPNKPVV